MNLHITNDDNGLFSREVAKRIKQSGRVTDNMVVNLSTAPLHKAELITYIPVSVAAIKKYISGIRHIDQLIFHPYNINSYRFLQLVLEKFPGVKVYWVCWSYDLYNLPDREHLLYEPFSQGYLKYGIRLKTRVKDKMRKVLSFFRYSTVLGRNYLEELNASFKHINYFCSTMPSDFSYYRQLSGNSNTAYLPFAYLSLNDMVPGQSFRSTGNKIMVGHSASPQGNHYEIIQQLVALNAGFSVFLPLVYGDKNYGSIIAKEAGRRFTTTDILTEHLALPAYYNKLTEVGWAIINVKVQQALGNILGLIWMGAKVFLDERTSTYKDLSSWGISVFTVQHHLNLEELSVKLTAEQVKNNRQKLQERFNEEQVKAYWQPILE
jgi:dTDP-N-acetylfucosamine:lipid II N-acetylfucosaminyltransferase